MKSFKELLKQGYLLLKYIHLLRYITLGLQVNVRLQKVFEVQYLMELLRFHLIQHHLQFRLDLRLQFSRQVQHLQDCWALLEGCRMLPALWYRQDFLWGILLGLQHLMGYLWMIQCLEFLLEVFLVRIPVRDLYHLQHHLNLQGVQGVQEYQILMPRSCNHNRQWVC